MVYNAMKLFMEINPQLFDDCSHDYTELQNSAEQRQASRKSKWDQIADLAKKKKKTQNGSTISAISGNPVKAAKADEIDPVTQDSQNRLVALKLQDENGAKDSKPKDHEEQNSVGSHILTDEINQDTTLKS